MIILVLILILTLAASGFGGVREGDRAACVRGRAVVVNST